MTNREAFQNHLQQKLKTQLERFSFFSDEEIANYVGRISVNIAEELKNFAIETDKKGDWRSSEKMAKWLKKEMK